jgi:RNA polymerase sigma-70 factor, ECF subfamily
MQTSMQAPEPFDSEAFSRLFSQNQRKLLSVALRMVGSLAEAEDVVQEAFVQSWRHRDSFRGEAAASTWLYRVTVNCALMKLRTRRRSRLEFVEELPQEASHLPSPDTAVIGREDERAVVRAFEQLAPIDQRILALRVVDGCTSDEVAQQTGLSSMAVRTRLHRAREKVRHACSELSA